MKKAIKWIITIAIALFVVYLLWNFIINGEKETYTAPLAAVKIAKPARADIDEKLVFNGYVEAQAMIPVVPFVSGTIEQYLASSGDYINKDQLLAVIDPKPYELQVEQAEAIFLSAKATFERVSNLFESGAVTQQNYDEAKAQYEAYKAQYDLANVQLDYTRVCSPVAGTVLMADSSVGAIAVQTSPLFVIADISKLEVNLDVPEKYFDILNDNSDKLSAVVERKGYSCKASVKSIAPYISPQSKTFKVTLELTGDVSAFRPGMFVSVELTYNTVENALVLEWSTRNTDTSVYSYDENTGCVKYEKVEIEASDDRYFAIDERYKNTWFVVDGQGSLLDGQKVNVL